MDDENIIEGGTAAAQIIEAARARKGAKLIDVAAELKHMDGLGPVPMLAVPMAGGGIEIHSVLNEVKAYHEWRRERPDRREGTAQLGTLDSFIDHARRFMDADSAIWISPDSKAPKFTSVLDYHEAVNQPEPVTKTLQLKPGDVAGETLHEGPRIALPRFGKHRGVHVPEFSDEWKLWTGANERALLQADFAKLVQLGAPDFVDVGDLPVDDAGAPRIENVGRWFHKRFGSKLELADFFASGSRMLEMAEGLTTTVEEKIGEVESLSGGSKAVVFESATRTTVQIPTAFLLEMPIFRGGDPFQIPARLRMGSRVTGDTKRLEWKISLWGVDRAVAKELADMAEQVKARTGLPIFVGAPE